MRSLDAPMRGPNRRLAATAAGALLAAGLSACTAKPPVVQAEPAAPPPPVEKPAPEPKQEPPPLTFETIYFDYDDATLKPTARESLKRAAEALLARPDAKVAIEGHCDERGTDRYNVELGWKRAYAARDFLKRMGIDESRLYPISYGRSRPAVVGSDETAWSRNRRVEIVERK